MKYAQREYGTYLPHDVYRKQGRMRVYFPEGEPQPDFDRHYKELCRLLSRNDLRKTLKRAKVTLKVVR